MNYTELGHILIIVIIVLFFAAINLTFLGLFLSAEDYHDDKMKEDENENSGKH